MTDRLYLTPEEVVARYRNEVTLGTLANWRAATPRRGPSFVHVGRAVLYPVAALDAWDKQNLVVCDSSNSKE